MKNKLIQARANGKKFLIEVRTNGVLDFEKERILRKLHPYLFSLESYTIDQLCRYASYGQGRNKPTGPLELGEFMASIGVSYRKITWR